jgi:hypothetical protein
VTTTSSTQSSLVRTFEDERYGWARTRGTRHRAVLAEAALLTVLTAATVVAALTDAGWTTGFFVVWSAGMLLFIPLHSLLNLGIRGVFDRAAHSLDEHQQGLREHSHARVGWPASALTLAATVGGIALAGLTGHTVLGLCLGFLLWFTAGLLPYWHLAWTLADEDDVDEDRDALPA